MSTGVKAIGALILVAALAAGGYGIYYLFLRPAAPAPVGAVGSSAPPATASAPASPGESPAAGQLDGEWKVDTSIGSFSDFSGSFVGYRVQEELAGVGGQTAVGRTPNVSGTMRLAGTSVTAAEVTADLTTLQSDDNRRDGQLRRQAIETDQFPNATFKLASPIDLGTLPAEGAAVKVQAKGQLTLHGQTKDVDIALEAKRSGNLITITGSLPIVFSDYGIQKPSSFLVLSVEDNGVMELQLHFTHA